MRCGEHGRIRRTACATSINYTHTRDTTAFKNHTNDHELYGPNIFVSSDFDFIQRNSLWPLDVDYCLHGTIMRTSDDTTNNRSHSLHTSFLIRLFVHLNCWIKRFQIVNTKRENGEIGIGVNVQFQRYSHWIHRSVNSFRGNIKLFCFLCVQFRETQIEFRSSGHTSKPSAPFVRRCDKQLCD